MSGGAAHEDASEAQPLEDASYGTRCRAFLCFSVLVLCFARFFCVFLCFSVLVFGFLHFYRFFCVFLCSRNIPAPGASGNGFGPGAYFSPVAGRRSGRYLRSKRGIRLQAQLRLAHVPTRSFAFLARFAPVPTRIFVGSYSPLAGAILEGPRGQTPYC